jgi:hypothetical protein
VTDNHQVVRQMRQSIVLGRVFDSPALFGHLIHLSCRYPPGLQGFELKYLDWQYERTGPRQQTIDRNGMNSSIDVLLGK